MKKLITLLALVFCLNAKAQVYQKMLADSITEFDVLENYIPLRLIKPNQALSSCNYAMPGIWYIKKDSLYKGKTYKKITSSGTYYNQLSGLIREDTTLRRVYFIPYCDTTEVLLYNFSLLQGDTITYNFPNSGGQITSGVFTVDSIKLKRDYKNYYHNHFYLRNHNTPNTYSSLEMIEGVGSVTHPLFLYCYFGPGAIFSCSSAKYDEVLSCKWNNGFKVYYDSCAFLFSSINPCYSVTDTCNYSNHCGGIEQYTNSIDVTISPNPNNGVFNLSINSFGKEKTNNIEIYNMIGECVHRQIATSSNCKINIAAISAGVYMIKIQTEEGSFTKKFIKE